MSIIKRHHTESYSVMANHCLRNKSLSAKAKGIFAYIMSLPEDWKLYRTELTNHFTDGKDSIRSGFDELIQAGYIIATESRDVTGRMAGWDYDIYEIPHTEKPTAENPPSDNPPLLSTDIQPSTDSTKTSMGSSEESIPEDFLEKFNQIAGHSFRVLDQKTKRQLRARIAEGFSSAEILKAAENCKKDKFHIENPQYLTPEFITRADKLQKYLNAGQPFQKQQPARTVFTV